jgi:hypothetical protein
MGKLAPNEMIDSALNYVGGSDYMCICSGSPATYTDAYTNLMLAKTAMTSGSFTVADAAGGGRQVTMTAHSGVSITNGGTALACALVKTGDTTLRYVTTVTSQVLTAGGTCDIPAWVITIGDPT